ASADSAALPHTQFKPSGYWLVVYFGITGSEPPAWLVESAEQSGKTIRLNFKPAKRDVTTEDLHQYFVWVPVGQLDAGTYTLELVDTSVGQMTMMRRVQAK